MAPCLSDRPTILPNYSTTQPLGRRVEEQYGSMSAYLDSIGIPESMRSGLREQLTQAV